MNVTIRCSVCKKRWPYAGSNPVAALDDHHANEHPEREQATNTGVRVNLEPEDEGTVTR